MRVEISFQKELEFFFPPREKKNLQQPKTFSFHGKRTVIDFIQSCGVPHTEVGEIIVNGSPVPSDTVLKDNDRIDVGVAVYTSPADTPCFLCDVHLWKLARRLRLLGFDTRFDRRMDDPELAETAHNENRFLLTRDRGLLMRSRVTYGCYIRAIEPEEQVLEILKRLKLTEQTNPFSRCFVCNTILKPVDMDSDLFKKTLKPRIPNQVLQLHREYNYCPSCLKAYWKGTHYGKLKEIIHKYR